MGFLPAIGCCRPTRRPGSTQCRRVAAARVIAGGEGLLILQPGTPGTVAICSAPWRGAVTFLVHVAPETERTVRINITARAKQLENNRPPRQRGRHEAPGVPGEICAQPLPAAGLPLRQSKSLRRRTRAARLGSGVLNQPREPRGTFRLSRSRYTFQFRRLAQFLQQ